MFFSLIVISIMTLRIPKLSYKNFYFFCTIYKNGGKNINFNNIKIRKNTFYKNKIINNIEDIDVNNMLVSKKEAYGNKNSFKYFIGYNDNDIIGPLCIRLSEMTGYAKKFDKINSS